MIRKLIFPLIALGVIVGVLALHEHFPAKVGTSYCSSSASPAVCASASFGSVVIATSATTVVVNTTAVTANSQIRVLPDSSLGAKLGVTCNALATITDFDPAITARTAGTSFTISITGPVAVNPACFSYTIIN
jgi:archaellum component FlaF (FlaF/FlaG flagellin family)